MKNNIFKEYLFPISIILGLFLPDSNIFFQFVQALLPLILFYVYFQDRRNIKIPAINIVFIIVISISFVINAFIENDIEIKNYYRMLSLILLFGLFPFVSNVNISNKLLYFAASFILFSQIAYVFNIGFLVKFFDTYFPYYGDVRGFTTDYLLKSANNIDDIVDRRYGGLYHNPNQTVRYVSVLLIVFFLENRKSDFKNIILFILITIVSFILAGSRTGFVVGAVSMIAYFLFLQERKSNVNLIKYILIIGFISGIFLLSIYGASEIRIFQISEGVEGSLGGKILWFMKFFNQLDSPIRLFFGHFSSNNINKLYGVPLLDSEWGELFYSYGIIGSIVMVLFYFDLILKNSLKIRYFLIILLWGITSSIIFSFRMSFIFMLFLSKYYSEYLNRNYNK